MNIITLSIILTTLIQLNITFNVNAFTFLNDKISPIRKQTKLMFKINSVHDCKIKYNTDLYHLTDYNLTNIYTIIGSSTDNKCNQLIKRLEKKNKKIVFIDETLYEKNNIDKIIQYYNYKQKIDIENIKKPWIFYEYDFILEDEIFRHLF